MKCEKCRRETKSVFKVETESKPEFWCLNCIRLNNPGSGLTGWETITEAIDKLKTVFKKRTNTN